MGAINPETYRCDELFPLPVRVPSPSQALLTPRYHSLRVLSAFRARGHFLPLLSLPPLLSLWDFESASDLRDYPSNSHSVGLPLALQYSSELFNKSDGIVKDGIQVPQSVPLQIIITIFAHCFPRHPDEYDRTSIHFAIPHRSGDYPLSNQYPSCPAEVFATRFHACVVRVPVSNTTSLPSWVKHLLILEVLEVWRSHRVSARSGLRLSKNTVIFRKLILIRPSFFARNR